MPVTHPVLDWTTVRLAAGQAVAIGTVLSASGSVPGKPGARIAVTKHECFGTVGGAGLELQVISRLKGLLESPEGQVGGLVETFQLQKEAKGEAGTPLNSLCGGRVQVSMEVVKPMPHVLLCGGGHCAQSIAAACDNLEWRYSVFDVREEFAAQSMYPDARELASSTVDDFLSSENSDSLARYSDILLLGHDWAVDQDLLLGLLKIREADPGAIHPRIGVIGSKSKWKAFRAAANDAGITDSTLDEVDCPIGLDIGAESPAEIAIAVTAAIISRMKS